MPVVRIGDLSKENALMRSVRLRRPDDALYWSSRLRSDGCGMGKMGKMLFRLALRDNLDIGLMLEAERCAVDPKNADMVALAGRLAQSQKLWSTREGRQLVQLICSVQSDLSFRDFTDDELLLRLSHAIGDEARFADVIKIVHEIIERSSPRLFTEFASFLDERCKERTALRSESGDTGDADMEAAVGLFVRISGGPAKWTVAEETLAYLVVTWMVCGVFGQGEFCNAPRTRSGHEIEPCWAEAEDRRFESSWDGYANIVMMFDKHGRLEPDDPGVLFLAKDGRWIPVIREESGVYLVQSGKEPRTFYEVNLAVLSCTCKDFMRRQEPCKHVRAVRAKAESELPFVIR